MAKSQKSSIPKSVRIGSPALMLRAKYIILESERETEMG